MDREFLPSNIGSSDDNIDTWNIGSSDDNIDKAEGHTIDIHSTHAHLTHTHTPPISYTHPTNAHENTGLTVLLSSFSEDECVVGVLGEVDTAAEGDGEDEKEMASIQSSVSAMTCSELVSILPEM